MALYTEGFEHFRGMPIAKLRALLADPRLRDDEFVWASSVTGSLVFGPALGAEPRGHVDMNQERVEVWPSEGA